MPLIEEIKTLYFLQLNKLKKTHQIFFWNSCFINVLWTFYYFNLVLLYNGLNLSNIMDISHLLCLCNFKTWRKKTVIFFV